MAHRLHRTFRILSPRPCLSGTPVTRSCPPSTASFLRMNKVSFATTARQQPARGERIIHIPRLPILLIGIGFACLGVGMYEYLTSDIQKYPPPIRQALRKALYYAQDKDTTLALDYFRQALALALESPEMERDGAPLTGIIIQLGVMLESEGHLEEARETLRLAFRHLVGFENEDQKKNKRENVELFDVVSASFSPQTQKKLVGIAQKLGDISDKLQLEEAEKWYVWSVESLLKTAARPESSYGDSDNTVFNKEHMPSWLTHTELGGAMEALGSFYASRERYMQLTTIEFRFAIQLYLRALTLEGLETCHTAVLMNNLAEAYAAMGRFHEAKQWTQRGLDLVQNPNIFQRSSDEKLQHETHGALLYNMGMLLEETGDKTKATQLYKLAGLHGRKYKLTRCTKESDKAIKRVEFEQKHASLFDQ
ncbi:hypothetical protein BDF14DRAFT_1879332 [Spinellus fusiger]|nr:hypothetical protein BDF14DRAFT_1879332 [Spinellus fusiger]